MIDLWDQNNPVLQITVSVLDRIPGSHIILSNEARFPEVRFFCNIVLIHYTCVYSTIDIHYVASSSPLDLRIAHQPLHTRLSPASAGFPGDDVADIRLIREDWVHTKSRELCIKKSTHGSKYTIRFDYRLIS